MGFTEDQAAKQQAYKQEMERRRQQAQGDKDMRKYLSTLPTGERAQYLADRAEVLDEQSPPSPFTPIATKPQRQPSAGAATPMMDPIDLMAAQHMSQGARMAKTTNDAIQDEMDRRVAISREQRRMAHELEKKRMDQETERMKVEALLKRLEMENGGSGYTTIYH